MKLRNFTLLATGIMSSLLTANPSFAIGADLTNPTTFFTGQANLNSTLANPFVLRISRPGLISTVNVTNINAGDSAVVKASKIRAAIAAQAPGFRIGGIQEQVRIERANKVEILADPTKERFDKLLQGVEYKASFTGVGIGSGRDPFNNASLVQVGIENLFIAQVTPIAGESSFDIFTQLETLLDNNGINVTFDSLTGVLSLDDLLQPDQNFVFGNTDTSLNTIASVESQTQSVPESSSNFGLLIFGVLSTGLFFKHPKNQSIEK